MRVCRKDIQNGDDAMAGDKTLLEVYQQIVIRLVYLITQDESSKVYREYMKLIDGGLFDGLPTTEELDECNA
jgi:hypothetical protein